MAAYLGLDPIGEPHPRYEVVKSMPWAGTVRYVEELGGKWAPSATYGQSIVKLINALLATPAPKEPEPPAPPEPEPKPEPRPEPKPPEEEPELPEDPKPEGPPQDPGDQEPLPPVREPEPYEILWAHIKALFIRIFEGIIRLFRRQ